MKGLVQPRHLRNKKIKQVLNSLQCTALLLSFELSSCGKFSHTATVTASAKCKARNRSHSIVQSYDQ